MTLRYLDGRTISHGDLVSCEVSVPYVSGSRSYSAVIRFRGEDFDLDPDCPPLRKAIQEGRATFAGRERPDPQERLKARKVYPR